VASVVIAAAPENRFSPVTLKGSSICPYEDPFRVAGELFDSL